MSHLANVEALVERAAAEAATRSGAGQMDKETGAPPGYSATSVQVCCFIGVN